jgi:hypothetical protein
VKETLAITPLRNSVCAYGGNYELSFLAFAKFAALLQQLGDNARPSGLMTSATP